MAAWLINQSEYEQPLVAKIMLSNPIRFCYNPSTKLLSRSARVRTGPVLPAKHAILGVQFTDEIEHLRYTQMADEAQTKTSEPDLTDPSDERKAELRTAYEEGSDSPYQGVHIGTLGELYWIFAERNWSGTPDLPEGMTRPNLTKVDLSPYLSGTNLTRLHLSAAQLHEADLRWANLSGADLSEVDLSGADLYTAILSEATNLHGANLSGADLRGAELSEAKLNGANLHEADLSRAKLHRADLSGADLSEVKLTDADLRAANLSGATLTRALLNSGTNLDGVELVELVELVEPTLLGVRWNGAPLDAVDWSQVDRLGDEAAIGDAKTREDRIASLP